MSTNRRTFLRSVGAGLALAATPGVVHAAGAPSGEQPSPSKALATLMAGNARYVEDRRSCQPLSVRRERLAHGQNPFAIVVSCADSRVPAEIVFDQTLGDIFGIRVAGNFAHTDGIGSIEYAVASFKTPLILVLGHTECGAVKAAVGYVQDGATQPGSIQAIVDAIAPAARETKGASDWVKAATERNVRDTIVALRAHSSIVSAAVRDGELQIAGGVYDLHSGKVTILS